MANHLQNESQLLDFHSHSFRIKNSQGSQHSILPDKTVVSSDFSCYFKDLSEEKFRLNHETMKRSHYLRETEGFDTHKFKQKMRRSNFNEMGVKQIYKEKDLSNQRISLNGSCVLGEVSVNMKRIKRSNGSLSFLGDNDIQNKNSIKQCVPDIDICKISKNSSRVRKNKIISERYRPTFQGKIIPKGNRTSIIETLKITSQNDENQRPKRHINFLCSGSDDMLTCDLNRMSKTEITRLMAIYGDVFQKNKEIQNKRFLKRIDSGIKQEIHPNIKINGIKFNERSESEMKILKNPPNSSVNEQKMKFIKINSNNKLIQKDDQTLLGKRGSMKNSKDNLFVLESFNKLGSLFDSKTPNGNIFLQNSLVMSNSEFKLSVNEFRENSFMKQFKPGREGKQLQSFKFASNENGFGSKNEIKNEIRKMKSQNFDCEEAIDFGSFRCKTGGSSGLQERGLGGCSRLSQNADNTTKKSQLFENGSGLKELCSKTDSFNIGNQLSSDITSVCKNKKRNCQASCKKKCKNKIKDIDQSGMTAFNYILENSSNLFDINQFGKNIDKNSLKNQKDFLEHLNNLHNYYVDVQNKSFFLKIGSIGTNKNNLKSDCQEFKDETKMQLIPFKEFLTKLENFNQKNHGSIKKRDILVKPESKLKLNHQG